MKCTADLESKLNKSIARFKNSRVSSNASYNAPIDKRNLEELQSETAKALEAFKVAILDYLTD
ncbi:MAG: hypothetical protein FWD48_01030 [Oscillospiraceae bacterium]|nr:hypothetical protein [Oscillospiraceae bacterium]